LILTFLGRYFHNTTIPIPVTMDPTFWATYRLTSPVECCWYSPFHRLYCGHIVATPRIERCAGNCSMPWIPPQPTSELTAIASDLSGDEFLCPYCVAEAGSTHDYVLNRGYLRDKKVVVRPCYTYSEQSVAAFQDPSSSESQTTSLNGLVLPCLNVAYGVPSPYHILECGHLIRVIHGYPADCAYNCGSGIDWSGIFDCPACLDTGVPIDPIHGDRIHRACEYVSPEDLAFEELADEMAGISMGQQPPSNSMSNEHFLQCGHQVTTNELVDCAENCCIRCVNFGLANSAPGGQFECKICKHELDTVMAGMDLIELE
jgi:hypothetical protein